MMEFEHTGLAKSFNLRIRQRLRCYIRIRSGFDMIRYSWKWATLQVNWQFLVYKLRGVSYRITWLVVGHYWTIFRIWVWDGGEWPLVVDLRVGMVACLGKSVWVLEHVPLMIFTIRLRSWLFVLLIGWDIRFINVLCWEILAAPND